MGIVSLNLGWILGYVRSPSVREFVTPIDPSCENCDLDKECHIC